MARQGCPMAGQGGAVTGDQALGGGESHESRLGTE
ncbi:hypothetical protein Pla111_04710 [Botrimarina hoheduenensis]|uniref:Uncharacterized protein n=1 Tax=Botrimarina hoheduenensis TaxID=2528000 RepID=A0A5C5WCR2_9BACT|nr:hypothetical protein Pla111_04710 [Botrimarina hoheduenensis]